MSNSINKPLSLAIGAAFLGSMALAPIANAANPFQINDLDRGYMVSGEEKQEEGKCGEGKCGEGQCGEGSCGENHGDESEEGDDTEEDKGEEGKCGEGSCGAA